MDGNSEKRGRFKTDEGGATALEFAFIAPAFIWLLFVTLEFGVMLFSRAMVESETQKISRQAMVGGDLGGGASRNENIEMALKEGIKAKTIGIQEVNVSTDLYDNISSVGVNPAAGGSSVTFGGRNQIVRYKISTEYRFMTPAAQWLSNMAGTSEIISTMYVKNEAF